MISSVVPIVMNILTGCLNAVITLFDRLGAVPYLIAVGVFVAFMRFLVLPLLDYGPSVHGISNEAQTRESHESSVHGFHSSVIGQRFLDAGD